MTTLLRLLLLCLALMVPPQARAQITDVSQAVRVEVLPGWRRADGVHVAALRIGLGPGWKTYWRSAGAAGISPRMDWRASRGVRSVTPAWPTPRVFRQGPALSIGYDRDFVLPLLIVPDGGPVVLRGRLDIGVCADICLPAQLAVDAVLTPGAGPDPRIVAALADRPRTLDVAAHCALRPIAGGFALTARIAAPPQGRDEAVVFEVADPGVWITDAATRREGGHIDATSQLLAAERRPFGVDRSRLRMTVIGTRGAVEVFGCSG